MNQQKKRKVCIRYSSLRFEACGIALLCSNEQRRGLTHKYVLNLTIRLKIVWVRNISAKASIVASFLTEYLEIATFPNRQERASDKRFKIMSLQAHPQKPLTGPLQDGLRRKVTTIISN